MFMLQRETPVCKKIKLFCVPGWLGFMSPHIPLLAFRLPEPDFCNSWEVSVTSALPLFWSHATLLWSFSHTPHSGPPGEAGFPFSIMSIIPVLRRAIPGHFFQLVTSGHAVENFNQGPSCNLSETLKLGRIWVLIVAFTYQGLGPHSKISVASQTGNSPQSHRADCGPQENLINPFLLLGNISIAKQPLFFEFCLHQHLGSFSCPPVVTLTTGHCFYPAVTLVGKHVFLYFFV